MHKGLVDQVHSTFDSQVLIVDDRQSGEDTTYRGHTVEEIRSTKLMSDMNEDIQKVIEAFDAGVEDKAPEKPTAFNIIQSYANQAGQDKSDMFHLLCAFIDRCEVTEQLSRYLKNLDEEKKGG
jgi:hypothetical protein